MKLWGALLIIVGTSSIGFFMAGQIALRPKQLQQLKTALEMLKTEIDYGFTPLPQAFKRLANNLASPIANIFIVAQNKMEQGLIAQAAWEDAILKIFPETALLNRDKNLLLEIGYNLGNSNSLDQIRHLDLAQEKIETLYLEAVQEKKDKVKLWRYLGVLGGLLVVIIIV
ncbi:MAG: stage III sporulation protein SpoIIIAB [Bacillota bacterium]